MFTSIGSFFLYENLVFFRFTHVFYNLLLLLLLDWGLGLAQTTLSECPFIFKPISATLSAANSADVLVEKLMNAHFVLCATIIDLISPKT